jgi:hypothetical protein
MADFLQADTAERDLKLEKVASLIHRDADALDAMQRFAINFMNEYKIANCSPLQKATITVPAGSCNRRSLLQSIWIISRSMACVMPASVRRLSAHTSYGAARHNTKNAFTKHGENWNRRQGAHVLCTTHLHNSFDNSRLRSTISISGNSYQGAGQSPPGLVRFALH